MIEIARRWRVLASVVAAGMAGVVGLAGATASAQPVLPQPPLPPSVTATQPMTPNAAMTAPQSLSQPSVTSATQPVAAAPGGLATPGGISTPPVLAPAPAPIVPATTGTLTDFFHEKGVTLEPQTAPDFKALNIVLPVPKGWAQVPDPNVPDAFAVIADRVGGNGLYSSNAQVVIYKLVGQFDPKEAISHGFVDSQQLPAWRSTDGSIGDFGGMPSSVIEGTYRENSMTLNTSRRHVIAYVGPDNTYLVTLSVTTSVDQVVPAADATDAIVRGFGVSVPGQPAATTPAPATPAAPSPNQQLGAHAPIQGLPG
jgi:hypothetical protein